MSSFQIFNVGIWAPLTLLVFLVLFGLGSGRSGAVFLGLIIDRLRHLGEPVAIAATADDVADAALGPEQRAVLVRFGVAHLRCTILGLGRVDLVAIPLLKIIHKER